MKKLILSWALVATCAACKSQPNVCAPRDSRSDIAAVTCCGGCDPNPTCCRAKQKKRRSHPVAGWSLILQQMRKK